MAAVVGKCARLLVFGGIILTAAAFGGLFGCRLAAMMPLALWVGFCWAACSLVRVGVDAEWSADMVQDDCRLREPPHPMRT